jgi:hypothetical protein
MLSFGSRTQTRTKPSNQSDDSSREVNRQSAATEKIEAEQTVNSRSLRQGVTKYRECQKGR